MTKFNDLGPPIDRIFRTMEMIAITAVFAAVAKSKMPEVEAFVTYLGTWAALTYLAEPTVNRLGAWTAGEKPTILGAVRLLLFLFATGLLTLLAVPRVAAITVWIGELSK